MTGSPPPKMSQREWILMVLGAFLLFFTIVIMPAIGYEFHFEYLLAGLALCGVSLASGMDKR